MKVKHRELPISSKWDTELSYQQIKNKSLFAFYDSREQFPVWIVMKLSKRRAEGFTIGHWSDGIIVQSYLSISKDRIVNSTMSTDIDKLVRKFLDKCGFW